MAQIVAAMAMTHAPGMTGWFTQAPKDHQELTLRATAALRQRLVAARPDVVIMFSNDHLLNWPMNNMPEYTVGIACSRTSELLIVSVLSRPSWRSPDDRRVEKAT